MTLFHKRPQWFEQSYNKSLHFLYTSFIYTANRWQHFVWFQLFAFGFLYRPIQWYITEQQRVTCERVWSDKNVHPHVYCKNLFLKSKMSDVTVIFHMQFSSEKWLYLFTNQWIFQMNHAFACPKDFTMRSEFLIIKSVE